MNQTSHKVSCEVLADVNFGLPCFNIEHYQMKPYAYAYGTSIRNANTSDFIDKLIKIDIPARKVSAEWYQEGTYVTEPVFIASPNSTAEDDGLLISTVFDTSVDKSFIVVLDARDLKEVSRVNLDYKVLVFHS